VALSKANRLKHRHDFTAVFRQGKSRHSSHLTLRALRQKAKATPSEILPTRVGISISQKVSKKATIRNRIKRQLKAAFRHLLPRLKSGFLLVVVVKPGSPECDYWQFLQELEQLLADAEVINGH
jgi:ribonuclease P protein component